MSDEKFCPEHGPYPASYDSCPICSGRPGSPPSLSDMEAETNPGGYGYGDDAADTVIPGRNDAGAYNPMQEGDTVIGTDVHRAMDETYVPTKRRPTTEAILWVMDGDRRGKWYPIHAGTKIGRKDVDLVLDDDQVSAAHARITVEGGKYHIWDFGSSNGTFVNGKRIREATPIEENDKIKIGKTTFVVKLLDAKKKTPAKRSTSSRSKTKKSTKTSSTAKKTTSSKS